MIDTSAASTIIQDLQGRFGEAAIVSQATRDDIPTLWVPREQAPAVLRYLKQEAAQPYRMLYDLTAIDERRREHRDGQPDSDFTVVYQLSPSSATQDIRIKVALKGECPTMPTVIEPLALADWYEREVWDMFGIRSMAIRISSGILMPPTWEGHPLRKDHPARATEMGPFQLDELKVEREQEALRFKPEDWGMQRHSDEDTTSCS